MEENKLSYEEALQEIEDILIKLEKGEIGVDEISKLVKRASFLLNNCQTQLRSIEKDLKDTFKAD